LLEEHFYLNFSQNNILSFLITHLFFQAFAIAISGRVGTGNIAGVAIAIAMGGHLLKQHLGNYIKTGNNGQYRGGPAFYIEKGLGIKWYAMLFALVTIISTALFLPGV